MQFLVISEFFISFYLQLSNTVINNVKTALPRISSLCNVNNNLYIFFLGQTGEEEQRYGVFLKWFHSIPCALMNVHIGYWTFIVRFKSCYRVSM